MPETALIVLDVQNGVLEMLKDHFDTDAYLAAVNTAAAAARAAGVPVVQVSTGFRRGYPDSNPRNTSVGHAKSLGLFQEGHASTELHPALFPGAEGDVRVVKRRVSALHATDLDLVLRSLGCTRVVLCGLITSGAVLSTARQAADLDYGVTLLEDLCRDRDEEVQRVLVHKVLARHAAVTSSGEWAASLGAGAGAEAE